MPVRFRPAWALLPLWIPHVCAQPLLPEAPHSALEPIVVVGQPDGDRSTLTQPDLPAARQQLRRTPGGASVLDAERYREGRVSTLADTLGTAPGVYVQARFGAEESRLSIRGSGLQRTFHGRGIKLMQDGAPLNLADGSFDFQAVDALSARHVEVWRGANALRYGASTLGGAVNFVSPNGYNAEGVRLRTEAGSFGYRRLHVSSGGVRDRFDHYMAASGLAQEGFREHARQHGRRYFANLGYLVDDDLETRFYVGHVNSDSELPGALTKAQLERDPRAANGGSAAGDQRRDIRWTRVSNRTVYRRGADQVEAFGHVSDKRLHHPIFQVLEQSSLDYGIELRYTHRGELAGRPNRVTVGLAHSHGTTKEDRYVNQAGRPGARTNRTRQTARNVEVYAENQHHLAPAWSVVAGVQAARADRRLSDRFVAGTASDPVPEDFAERYRGVSPKLGVLWDYTPQVQFFANASRSFEPPSFGELAGGLRPNLTRAQRGTGWEVGTRGRSGRVEWDIVFYETHLRDELLQIATDSAGANITINARRTVHRGVEAGLHGQAFADAQGRVEWQVNGLWNDFRFRDDPTYGSRRLPGVPSVFARAQLGYRLAGGALVALHAESAGGYAVDFADTLRADGYVIWGLRASGRLLDRATWFVEGRNLSNRRYAATTNVIRSAGGVDGPHFLPGDGRGVFAGVDWKLD
ncbi:MAG TPA: TonB-dependent receptor [Burkholderiaceae bacterium]|nr:TonB-dependent receptor [Burkholderiaceae bacterium]